MPTARPSKKVLLLEFNEITWTVANRLIAEGKMPNLARMKQEGAWGAPEAIERAPHLDPWITWVTLHTGVDRSVHGATVLEQDQATLGAKRSWEYALDAGKSVGVFGSIGAFPPKKVPGFMVPGPFAPASDTYPAYIAPVQALNRKYTQVHHKNVEQDSPFVMAKLGLDLLGLGLSPATCVKIGAQLAGEKLGTSEHWRRVMLQPEVNFDFFKTLYKRYQPDFATWHTNHAAHFMHHYWRAWDDTAFGTKPDATEKRKFGAAVEAGYMLVDDLIGRFQTLIDDETVLVIASSMGQKPYYNPLYPNGKVLVKFKDVNKVLELVGADGVGGVAPAMDPQWNIRVSDPAKRASLKQKLSNIRCEGGVNEKAMFVEETGEILTVSPYGLAKLEPGVRYFFDGLPGEKAGGYAFDELFRGYGDTNKEGMHDPPGMLLLKGPGIVAGTEIGPATNLDIAPTMLSLMGIPVPDVMSGRVLSEAWGERSQSLPAETHVVN
jgi:hypothetical protein